MLKTKRTTKAKRAKKVKKPAVRASAKKAKRTKKPAAKKTAKKVVAKTSPAKKTVNKEKQGGRKPAETSVKKAANKRAIKTATEKTAWKISPEISQSVVDIDIWKKGDLKIEHLTVYRTGWIVVDQLPDLSGYNPDEGVSIFEEFEFEEHQVLDGSEETSFFPNELALEERERLMALSEEELVVEGWTIESATRFSGPLVVEEI
ncbi:hypothetical protein [Bradyrhizobium sp.]|uniref:hypothetical protein n=1 Tax=Bradyrhizobium sp. TaxID=376 RepID=UPI003BAEBBF5